MRLTFAATRVNSTTASATTTTRIWREVTPARAPSLAHSSAKTPPTSTITALASHGRTSCRSRPASRVNRPGFGAAAPWAGAVPWAGGVPLPWAAAPSAFHLASPVGQDRATAVTAAIRPATAASEKDGLAPKPKKCAIVPNDPRLRVSQEISGGAASIARARPAVSVAAQLTSVARLAPRSRSSGFSDVHQCTRRLGRSPGGSSVSHQYPNSTSVIPAAITDGSHQASVLPDADIACGPDGTAAPCQRSSHPQA